MNSRTNGRMSKTDEPLKQRGGLESGKQGGAGVGAGCRTCKPVSISGNHQLMVEGSTEHSMGWACGLGTCLLGQHGPIVACPLLHRTFYILHLLV